MENKNILFAFFMGLIPFLVNIGIAVYQEQEKQNLERKQYESNLILKSLLPESIDQSKRNLKFLIESGLISRDNEKIINLLNDTSMHLILPSIGGGDIYNDEYRSGGVSGTNDPPGHIDVGGKDQPDATVGTGKSNSTVGSGKSEKK